MSKPLFSIFKNKSLDTHICEPMLKAYSKTKFKKGKQMNENLIQKLKIDGGVWFEVSEGFNTPQIFPTRFQALKFLEEEGLLDEDE